MRRVLAKDRFTKCSLFFLIGSAFIHAILQKGFDERHAYIGGMFGAGKFTVKVAVMLMLKIFCSVMQIKSFGQNKQQSLDQS